MRNKDKLSLNDMKLNRWKNYRLYSKLKLIWVIFFSFFFSFFCLFAILGPAPPAYGGSQGRGPIGAVATGLHQSHSYLGSEPRLWPTLQLTATPDPEPTEQGQGLNLQPHGSCLDSLTTEPQWELLQKCFTIIFLSNGYELWTNQIKLKSHKRNKRRIVI